MRGDDFGEVEFVLEVDVETAEEEEKEETNQLNWWLQWGDEKELNAKRNLLTHCKFFYQRPASLARLVDG